MSIWTVGQYFVSRCVQPRLQLLGFYCLVICCLISRLAVESNGHGSNFNLIQIFFGYTLVVMVHGVQRTRCHMGCEKKRWAEWITLQTIIICEAYM